MTNDESAMQRRARRQKEHAEQARKIAAEYDGPKCDCNRCHRQKYTVVREEFKEIERETGISATSIWIAYRDLMRQKGEW